MSDLDEVYDLNEALRRLNRLNDEVKAAEQSGHIDLLKLEEIARVRAELFQIDPDGLAVNDARALFARAMDVPAFHI